MMSIFAGCSSHTEINPEQTSTSSNPNSVKKEDNTKSSELSFEETNNEYRIKLSDEQINNLDSITYSIIGQNENEYYPLLSNRKATLDADNTVRISKDQSIMTLYFENTNQYLPIPNIEEKTDENDSLSWTTRALSLNDGHDTLYDNCPMEISISYKKDNTKSFLKYSSEVKLPEISNPLTESVAYEYWNNILINYPSIDCASDISETTVPCTEWPYENNRIHNFNYPNIKNGFNFQLNPVSQINGTYYCQLILKLKNNTFVVSNLMSLQNDNKNPFTLSEARTLKETIYTENGRMIFKILKDNVHLTEYTGDDIYLKIPDNINNIPVTVIDDSAFSNNSILKKVQLPSSLKQINAYAFYGTNLCEINLPETLEYIGHEAFGCLSILDPIENDASLISEISNVTLGKNVHWIGSGAFDAYYIQDFYVDSDNPYYVSLDGCVYTKDHSFLLSSPTAKNGDFHIPDGTIKIDTFAFKNNGSFSHIASCNNGITSLTLSDSVKSFSCDFLPENIDSLSIGIGLKNWFNIYNCPNLSKLIINSKNANFQYKNGVIYNKNTTFLYYYSGINTALEFKIPETVIKIDPSAFFNASYLRTIIIPQNSQLTDKELSDLSSCLSSAPNLVNVIVEDKNVSFCSIDGVLFTIDHSVLLCYPCQKTANVYSIPEGTDTICSHAFYNNKSIMTLNFPATLEYLKLDSEDSIFLRNILNLTNITISKENPFFFSQGPFLCSVYEKKLVYTSGNYDNSCIHLPKGISAIAPYTFASQISISAITELHIPEGTNMIANNNFNYITQNDQWDIIDIYLPDSLINISSSSFQDSPGIVIHASPDSYAASYAKKNHITLEPFK